jgi:hypothetical protein
MPRRALACALLALLAVLPATAVSPVRRALDEATAAGGGAPRLSLARACGDVYAVHNAALTPLFFDVL